MSLSRAEFEEMSTDELIDELIGLDRRLKDTQQVVYERLLPQVTDTEAVSVRLEERLDALESRVELLEGSTGGKETKVRQIVDYVLNVRDSGQSGVVVTAKEIVGATGCSRRYAYDLIDDLPKEYPWILSRQEATQRQYGHLEIDQDKQ